MLSFFGAKFRKFIGLDGNRTVKADTRKTSPIAF